ncbi:Clr5 domain-containing protein [Triangularia setosa]|uniref:Clr5 domain-containing protein n=1 Tax=Triangularia setosa TaxID=2587417 RepID=A0AAN6WDN2_9PEZI|nr:Clr5 domain-containing protein [Podospora setosa]
MTKPWEQFREVIIAEYRDNNRPLKEVKQLMEERYRFRASIRAYRSRFDKWGIQKYSRRRRGNSMGEDAETDDARYLSPHQSPELDDNSYQASSPATITGDLFHPRTSATAQSNGYGGPFIRSEPPVQYGPCNMMSVYPGTETNTHLLPMSYNTYPHPQTIGYPSDQMSACPHRPGNVLGSAPASPNPQSFQETPAHMGYGYSYNYPRR